LEFFNPEIPGLEKRSGIAIPKGALYRGSAAPYRIITRNAIKQQNVE